MTAKSILVGGFFGGLAVALAITMLPRVWNPDTDYGQDLPKKSILAAQTIQNIDHQFGGATTKGMAFMVVKDGQVLYERGETDRLMNGHSTRKAFLSLLYGIAVEQGLIDLDKSLADLAIDEATPLTDQEKTATIRDLLMARSGIYLPAEGEHDEQLTHRPKREQHKPGEYFFYNNFDFNALGTIFIQETGQSIGHFMTENLAKPLGMQDFNANNIVMGDPWFMPTNGSLHDMYYMYLSARDFAKIGAMVANKGAWNNRQIVPRSWIDISTAPLSDLSLSSVPYKRYTASGYVWMIDEDKKTIWTDGYGGHFMLIDMERNLTIIERNFTGNSLLSTGIWLMNPNRLGPGAEKVLATHNILVKALDQ
ncbi:serine hydrolase domain-containing protein [Cohaesibacter gelatinilyticus]|uniref:CubicO group peptidase, beta-lactamase class C family n=1 Tax=Cohaesibacter gelatinilyticus TaxID=372072 RepID=A0A285PE12_9HYPH|nr:serine hydrolase [Cohaesibacter gelatinilyticus]SNZ19447.1 CubicO group peptidase, beta-lactamase class C family [Cohaesibacter gelatinilyticus]